MINNIRFNQISGGNGDNLFSVGPSGITFVDGTYQNTAASGIVQNALDSKAPINNPSFTGTVSGITKGMVGLDNVDNTSDINKPISTLTQNALDLKTNISTPILSLGTLSGSNPINFATDRLIQTLTLNGNSVTFTKGSGWPTDNTSVDVVLRMSVTTDTSITWNIVTDWFNQPIPGPLSSGTHIFLLRAIGSSIIEGHYIGSKTN